MKSNYILIAGLVLMICVGLLGLGFCFVQGTRAEEGIGTLAGLATLFLGLPGLLLFIWGLIKWSAERNIHNVG